MANFNKVLLMGNLTRDPQLSYLPSQTPVVDFGLAVNRNWTAKDGTKKQETCFVDCRAFGRPAENINKYCSKGRSIFVEGRLVLESWTAQDGSKRSRHRVLVDNCQFLGGPAGAGSSVTEQAEAAAAPEEPSSAGPVEPGDFPPEAGQGRGDDIPF